MTTLTPELTPKFEEEIRAAATQISHNSSALDSLDLEDVVLALICEIDRLRGLLGITDPEWEQELDKKIAKTILRKK
jgi:hypothetical protein